MSDSTSEVDWVTARSGCSAETVFRRLEQQVKHDVGIRNKLLDDGDLARFSVTPYPQERQFVVHLTNAGDERTVLFARDADLIRVASGSGDLILQATVALGSDGVCRLVVNDEPIEDWQFRMQALESLFFGLPPGTGASGSA